MTTARRFGLLSVMFVCFAAAVWFSDGTASSILTGFGTIAGVLQVFVWCWGLWRGPSLGPRQVLELLRDMTVDSVSLGPQARASSDDFPIPWTRTSGPGQTANNSPIHPDSGDNAFARLVGSTRPVVVVGGEGLGKSTLARRVVEHRRAEGSRPVLYIPLATWTPSDLYDWTSREIAIRSSRQGNRPLAWRTVRDLLADDRIDIVYDGLDEAPRETVSAFLAALTNSGFTSWILFTRPQPVELMPNQDQVVHDVVQLHELHPDIAAAEVAKWPDAWKSVHKTIRDHPRSHTSLLMRTPLFLAIARTIAQTRQAPPPPLLADPPPPSEVIAIALLTQLVSAAMASPGTTNPDGRRRWLRTLARTMERTGRDDFAWWDLRGSAPWMVTVAAGIAVVTLPMLVLEWLAGFAYRHTNLEPVLGPWTDAGIAVTAALIVAPVLAALTPEPAPGRSRLARVVNSIPVRVGITLSLIATIIDGGAWSWTTLPVFALFMTLTFGVAASRIIREVSKRWKPSGQSRSGTPHILGFQLSRKAALAAAIVGGYPLLILVPHFMSQFATIVGHSSDLGPPFVVRSVSAVLFASAILFALALLVLALGRRPDAEQSSLVTVGGNLRFGVVGGVVWGLVVPGVVLIVMWLLLDPEPPPIELTGAAADLFAQLSQLSSRDRMLAYLFLAALPLEYLALIMLTGAVLSSAGRFYLQLVLHAAVGRLPLQLHTFVEWARDSGILRRTGATYAFRHASIRKALDLQTSSDPDSTSTARSNPT